MATASAAPNLPADHLVSKYVRVILEDPHIDAFRNIGESELRLLVSHIVASLAGYLHGDDEKVGTCLIFVSQRCFRRSVPLIELAYLFYVFRDNLACQSENEVPASKARANQFFDRLVLELLQRY